MEYNKNLIIRDGLHAIYKTKSIEKEVVLYNVKKDSIGTYFNARDIFSNLPIRKNGYVVKWSAVDAINSNTITICIVSN